MALHAQQSRILMTNDDSPETFTEIEEVVSISGPDGTANLIDVTHLRSTGKEYLSGLADYGKIALEMNFTGDTKQMALRTKYANQAAAHAYKIEIPSGGDESPQASHIFTFNAVVLSWTTGEAVDAKVTLAVQLQISGAVDYSAPH